MMNRTLLTGMLLMAMWILMQSCGVSAEKSATARIEQAVPVQLVPLQKQTIKPEIRAAGQFYTDDETILSFKTGGIVGSIVVKEGDFVRKGQVVATLDQTEIRAMATQAQVALEKARRDYERAERLYTDSVATKEQFQNAKSALDMAQLQAEAAMFNLQHSEIRALADGYVLRKLASTGQVVAGGTPILQTNGGTGTARWLLKAGISDKAWASVKEGDSAVIYTDSYPDKPLAAVLSRKGKVADPVSGTFVLEMSLTGTQGIALASGMFGNAVVYTSAGIEVWAVPYEALLDANGGKGFVFATNDGKTAQKTEVDVVLVAEDYVYIASGLENYSQLIVAGSAYLRDGSPITLIRQ